jgi:hypothetical protein
LGKYLRISSIIKNFNKSTVFSFEYLTQIYTLKFFNNYLCNLFKFKDERHHANIRETRQSKVF